MSGITPLNMGDLGNLVRYWVHYDNQVALMNRQAASARTNRDHFEQQILDSLQRAKYEAAVIQIAGGRILVNEEKKTQSLTFKTLEDMLHEYFRQRPGPFQDETAAILKFIKGHRHVETVKRLKKVAATDGSKPETR
jgi:hypothetical protein